MHQPLHEQRASRGTVPLLLLPLLLPLLQLLLLLLLQYFYMG